MERMEPPKNYIEHADKAVETDKRFNHVMAIALNPASNYQDGVIRCITSREGNVEIKGYVDRSVLHKVSGTSLKRFSIGEQLVIKNENEIVKKLTGQDWDFIGLEDPDIFIDETSGLLHLYFTIPLRNKLKKETITHLGHAVGKDLNSLEMTMPVLMATEGAHRAKEVSIAPLNSQGFRYNLFESSDRKTAVHYSTVGVARADDMSKPWIFGGTIFHPAEHAIPWIAGHASPGPILPKTFIDIGRGKALGIMNGREANQQVGDQIKYGMFSIGLFIYDYEQGKIDWVSSVPLIRDSQAKTITFASQFVESGPGVGILYAHVDDSFVRAYTLEADLLKKLLP